MSILGISAFHHDSAAAIVKKHKVVFASHEERFSRQKYDKRWPQNAINYSTHLCAEIKTVVFYDKDNKGDSKSLIKKQFPKAEIEYVDHHESHAMSAICTTRWDECAVMVVDTVGGLYSTSLGVFQKGKIKWIKRFEYPNSLGLFYSTATRLLGFKPLKDESQVMAAAAFGNPKWSDWIENNVVQIGENNYQMRMDLRKGVGVGSLDWDVAASVQYVTEKILLNLAKFLKKETKLKNLAISGGVALNCVANTHLYKHSGFKNIAIQPAAGDAGCSLGAAALLQRPDWTTPYTGIHIPIKINTSEVAEKLLEGKIVALLHGKAEFGPRALGNRSLLALPTVHNSKLLHKLKGRITDTWRPWAPICLEDVATYYFEVYNKKYNYDMLFTADDKSSPMREINRICSARLQVVNYQTNSVLSEILKKTTKKDQPVLINTSANARGKPIVNTREDFYNEMDDYRDYVHVA